MTQQMRPTSKIRRGRKPRERLPGQPLTDARREAFAAHLAAGASLRDAYRGAGYDGDPDNGQRTDLANVPEVAARVRELQTARSQAIVAAAPVPVGLPTADTWLSGWIALVDKAEQAGAWSAAMAGRRDVMRQLGLTSQGIDTQRLTAEDATAAMLDIVRQRPEYARALARALALDEATWTQLQVAVHGYRQGGDSSEA